MRVTLPGVGLGTLLVLVVVLALEVWRTERAERAARHTRRRQLDDDLRRRLLEDAALVQLGLLADPDKRVAALLRLVELRTPPAEPRDPDPSTTPPTGRPPAP